jgi:hypothetical protein
MRKDSFTMNRLRAVTERNGDHVSAADASQMLNEVLTLRRLLSAAAGEMGAEDAAWGREAHELLGGEG